VLLSRIVRAYRNAFSGLARETWLLALVALINRAGSMVLPFLSLYATRTLGFTVVEAGQVLAAFGFGSMIGTPIGGWLTDRVGPLRVMQICFACTGAGYLALSQMRSFWSVIALVAATSAFADAVRPAIMAAVTLSSEPATRARSLALLRLALNLGTTMGPSLGGVVIARYPLGLFLGDTASAWTAVTVLTLALGRRRAPARAAEPEPATSPTSGNGAGVGGRGVNPWRDPPFLAFLALVRVLATAFFQILGTMPLYLRDVYGMPEPLIGAVLAVNGGCIVIFEMLLVKALERRDPLRTAAVGSLMICSGIAILALGRGAVVAYASALVWTFGEMFTLPSSNTAAGSRAGPGGTGRYMGAYTLAFSVAFLLAPVVGSAVYERIGPEVLWLGIGALGPLLFAGFLALSRAFRSSGAGSGAGARP
jgi:predicted MFS family arabinose efflux permease